MNKISKIRIERANFFIEDVLALFPNTTEIEPLKTLADFEIFHRDLEEISRYGYHLIYIYYGLDGRDIIMDINNKDFREDFSELSTYDLTARISAMQKLYHQKKTAVSINTRQDIDESRIEVFPLIAMLSGTQAFYRQFCPRKADSHKHWVFDDLRTLDAELISKLSADQYLVIRAMYNLDSTINSKVTFGNCLIGSTSKEYKTETSESIRNKLSHAVWLDEYCGHTDDLLEFYEKGIPDLFKQILDAATSRCREVFSDTTIFSVNLAYFRKMMSQAKFYRSREYIPIDQTVQLTSKDLTSGKFSAFIRCSGHHLYTCSSTSVHPGDWFISIGNTVYVLPDEVFHKYVTKKDGSYFLQKIIKAVKNAGDKTIHFCWDDSCANDVYPGEYLVYDTLAKHHYGKITKEELKRNYISIP